MSYLVDGWEESSAQISHLLRETIDSCSDKFNLFYYVCYDPVGLRGMELSVLNGGVCAVNGLPLMKIVLGTFFEVVFSLFFPHTK